jgi:hypothetical protein
MGNGLKRLSKAHQDLVLAIAQQLNDRDALAARVGGEAVMRSLPHGEQPFANDQMRTAAASLAGANQRHNNVDLLPLLKYVLVDTTCTFRYNVFGTPNCRADTHALLTCTALRMILGEHAGDDDDDDALWHRVFSAERDRVLRANARGARLVSHLSATTNGRRASFVYLDLNLLNKPSSSADICARGLVRRPLYNFRSYKSWLSSDMQQALADAEADLTKLRARKRIVKTIRFCLVRPFHFNGLRFFFVQKKKKKKKKRGSRLGSNEIARTRRSLAPGDGNRCRRYRSQSASCREASSSSRLDAAT